MEELLKVFIDGKGTFYQRVKLSDNIEKEPDTGFLYCNKVVLGHLGTQAYNGYEVKLPDKKVVYVRREEADVFDEDSLNSIKGKPVTLNHPEDMVNSTNFKKYVVGFIDEVWRDGDNIMGIIVIQDQEAIEAIESGDFKDVSLGYTAKLVPTGDGELKQENIVVNHISLVREGRAPNARILDEQTVEGDGEMDLKLSFEELAERVSNLEKDIVLEDEETVEQTDEQSQSVADEVAVDIEKEEQEKGEKPKMKTFIDFMSEFNVIQVMPKSEFRDKAYEALNVECKETLKVDLPQLQVVKLSDEAIDKSVGLADNLPNKEEEQVKKDKPLVADAHYDDRFMANIYKDMATNKQKRDKYASMNYLDVIDLFEGRNK